MNTRKQHVHTQVEHTGDIMHTRRKSELLKVTNASGGSMQTLRHHAQTTI